MVQDNSNLSPEKQLLKLIEEPQSPFTETKTAETKRATIISPAAMKGRWDFYKDAFLPLAKTWGGPLDIKRINGIVGLLCLVMGGFFVTHSVMLSSKLNRLPSFSFQGESVEKWKSLKQASQLKALNYYMEKVRSRDIFKLGRVSTALTLVPQGLSKAEEEAIEAKYKLVGISWSDNPDAMIEDVEGGKTHFLKRGQVIGDLKVRAIFKDKVVLEYKGQEIELQ